MTRNRDDFPLVFDENKEYGFRRNTLGLRTAGMAVAAVTFVLAAGLTLLVSPWFLLNMLIGLAVFAWWWHAVSPNWVRQPADLYAIRLLDASITLSPR
jgi:fatty acid desaturase